MHIKVINLQFGSGSQMWSLQLKAAWVAPGKLVRNADSGACPSQELWDGAGNLCILIQSESDAG